MIVHKSTLKIKNLKMKQQNFYLFSNKLRKPKNTVMNGKWSNKLFIFYEVLLPLTIFVNFSKIANYSKM